MYRFCTVNSCDLTTAFARRGQKENVMVASRSLSSGMNPRLHLNALSILSVVLFLFAFFASSTIASASPATVQDNSGYVADAASVAVAFSSNVTSGHAIIVAQSTYDAQTISTPTDTQGNSFTQVVTAGTSGAAVAAIYVAQEQRGRYCDMRHQLREQYSLPYLRGLRHIDNGGQNGN